MGEGGIHAIQGQFDTTSVYIGVLAVLGVVVHGVTFRSVKHCGLWCCAEQCLALWLMVL